LTDKGRTAEWLKKAKNGDDDAFGQLLKSLYRRAFITVFEIVPSYQDTEEILQDSFYRFYRSLKKLREDEDPFYFLRRIAIRRAYTHLKKRRDQISLEDIPEDTPQLTVADRELSPKDAYRWARELAPKQRMVFILREIMGLQDSEIAAALGISETTVRRHASLAKEAVLKQLQ